MTDTATTYLATWNETDPAARRARLARDWAAAATYVDPLAEVEGLDQLDATVAAVQAQFPGWVFTLRGGVDTHHGHTRFSWGLGPEGGEAVVEGSDVVVTDADGRISGVVGFLDEVPA